MAKAKKDKAIKVEEKRTVTKEEYRVRAVTRYVVTKFEEVTYTTEGAHTGGSASSSSIGEFANLESADIVGKALHAASPGSTFATIEERREPRMTVHAYEPEEVKSLMAWSTGEPDTTQVKAPVPVDMVDGRISVKMKGKKGYCEVIAKVDGNEVLLLSNEKHTSSDKTWRIEMSTTLPTNVQEAKVLVRAYQQAFDAAEIFDKGSNAYTNSK